MTQAEVERIAKTAAHEAVKETLETLGFDVAEFKEIQQDQAFLRIMRLGTRKSFFAAITAFVSAIMTAIAGAVWLLVYRP